MSERFFAESDFSASHVELSESETHHLAHVLHYRGGETVTLFNGRGQEATADIETISRRSTTVRILDVRTAPPDPGAPVTLAVAVPKGERFRWLVEKATELGVRELIPLQTERSVVNPGAGKLEKARQWVIAAAKQCRTSHLMHVSPVTRWDDFWAQRDVAEVPLIAHPGGQPVAALCNDFDADRRYCLLVGPEGGFTEGETSCAVRNGATVVDLGTNILRVETAAISLSAVIRLTSPIPMSRQ